MIILIQQKPKKKNNRRHPGRGVKRNGPRWKSLGPRVRARSQVANHTENNN